MNPTEFAAKARAALSGPPNFDRIWAMLEESGETNCQVKLFKNEGDTEPFRAIVFVNGEEESKAVLEFLDARRAAKA